MSKESFSVNDIRDYVESRKRKQGISEARRLAERCWVENKGQIMANSSSFLFKIADFFEKYGLLKIAESIAENARSEIISAMERKEKLASILDEWEQEERQATATMQSQRELEEKSHERRERRRRKRALKQGRPYVPRIFVPSPSVQLWQAELDGEDLDYIEGPDDNASDDPEDDLSADLEDFGILPPETTAEYKARTERTHIQSSGRKGGDRQNFSKLKGRGRKLNDDRREEKSL